MGIPAELGVQIGNPGDEMEFLAIREGKDIVKATLKTSGMELNYKFDLKNLKAMSEVYGQVVMAECMKF